MGAPRRGNSLSESRDCSENQLVVHITWVRCSSTRSIYARSARRYCPRFWTIESMVSPRLPGWRSSIAIDRDKRWKPCEKALACSAARSSVMSSPVPRNPMCSLESEYMGWALIRTHFVVSSSATTGKTKLLIGVWDRMLFSNIWKSRARWSSVVRATRDSPIIAVASRLMMRVIGSEMNRTRRLASVSQMNSPTDETMSRNRCSLILSASVASLRCVTSCIAPIARMALPSWSRSTTRPRSWTHRHEPSG
jgi:hypothetical protein